MAANLQTLLKSGADQTHFLAKPAPDAATPTEEVASLEREAEKALLRYCSFPEVRRHPRKAAIEARSQAWLADLYGGRLPAARVQRLLDTRLDKLGCVFYPNGLSDARSLTLNKLMHWYFVLDDVVDDPHMLGHNYEAACRYACRAFKAMFGGDMAAMVAFGLSCDDHDHVDDSLHADANDGKEDPPICDCNSTAANHDSFSAAGMAEAQQDLAIEVGVQWSSEMRESGIMSPRQLERLRAAVAEYLAGILGIVRWRQEKRLPTLEEYKHMRRMDFALHLYLLGCEFDLGIDLSDETLEHPLIIKLHEATTDQMMWINDLLTFNREFHNEDYVSLLPVLYYNKKDRDLPGKDDGKKAATVADFQEVICEARAMIKAVDEERGRVVAEIAEWKPELQPYVQATHWTLSGLTFWTLWSPRYQKNDPI